MKNILLVLVVLLVFPATALAKEIYLTCKPYPPDALITHFVIEKDALIWNPESVPKVLLNGSFVLWEDVSGLPSGNHNFKVKAVSGFDESEYSLPFVWSRRIPSLPVLKISVGP